jgi:hypothetical protein
MVGGDAIAPSHEPTRGLGFWRGLGRSFQKSMVPSAFAQSVVDFESRLFQSKSAVPTGWLRSRRRTVNYVAHEYFNADWLPMPFPMWRSTCRRPSFPSPHRSFIEHHDGMNLTADQQKLLNESEHPILKESVRDYMVNQQFRRIYG